MFQTLGKAIPLLALVTIAVQLQYSESRVRGSITSAEGVITDLVDVQDGLNERSDDPSRGLDNTGRLEPTHTGEPEEAFYPSPGFDNTVPLESTHIGEPEEVFDLYTALQRATDALDKVQRDLREANDNIHRLREDAASLQTDLLREGGQNHGEDLDVCSLMEDMFQEVQGRAAALAAALAAAQNLIGKPLRVSDLSPGRCDEVIDLYAAFTQSLISEARALSEFKKVLSDGHGVTMNEVRAVTRMMLSRLEANVVAATAVARM